MAGWMTSGGHYCVLLTLFCAHSAHYVEGAKRRKERSLLQFTDCGPENKLVHFQYVHAKPHPVVIPGTLYVSMAGNVTDDLPRRLDLHLRVRKYFFGYPFLIPCLGTGVGSCTFENICLGLERYEIFGCPRALRHHDMRCFCPFMAGQFKVHDLPINVPKIQGIAASLLNGDYELEIILQEEEGEQLGCLKVKFSMKKRSRGWLFKI